MNEIISFCPKKLNIKNLKNNTIIKCSKCNTNNGLWLYKNGMKIWIPKNKCKKISKLLKIPYDD